MWVKTNVIDSRVKIVNLDKVHYFEIYRTHDHSFWVRAYLDDGGCIEEYDTGFNTIRLHEGTLEECQDYVDWLHKELHARNDVAEYKLDKQKEL